MRVRPSIAPLSPSSTRIFMFIEPASMIEPFSRGLIHGTWPAMFLLAWLLPAAPSFAESPILSDPASLEKAIEQYIRTHPEVIEQSLQALETKRQEDERQRSKTALATRQNDLLHDPSSPVSGNLAGEITLVEFFDYRCGFCKRAAGAVTQLQQEDPRVRVVYKDLPILGEASELAAKAALASKIQGKHQAFHEALLASKGDLTKDTILAVAGEVGLDAKKLDADMQSPDLQSIIDRNWALAKDLGISGTPGFIVGTELVPGVLDLKGLKDLIARAGIGK
jgi:protein-disulfide isomerase